MLTAAHLRAAMTKRTIAAEPSAENCCLIARNALLPATN
jgi:hypothetical protein